MAKSSKKNQPQLRLEIKLKTISAPLVLTHSYGPAHAAARAAFADLIETAVRSNGQILALRLADGDRTLTEWHQRLPEPIIVAKAKPKPTQPQGQPQVQILPARAAHGAKAPRRFNPSEHVTCVVDVRQASAKQGTIEELKATLGGLFKSKVQVEG